LIPKRCYRFDRSSNVSASLAAPQGIVADSNEEKLSAECECVHHLFREKISPFRIIAIAAHIVFGVGIVQQGAASSGSKSATPNVDPDR